MAWAASTVAEIALGVAAMGTSAGIAVASNNAAAGAQPNLTASSAAMSDTNAAILPIQRGMTAAQQMGGEYTFSLPDGSMSQQLGSIPGLVQKNGKTTYNGAPIVKNPDGTYTANFKGFGAADVQGATANKNAANQLALSQKMDPQFIAEALKQQQLADPQSFAAHAQESKLIQDQINRPVNSPVSDMLNSQVQESLDAANNHSLTGIDQARLDAAVASAQGDRGGAGPATDFAAPLTTGFAGEQRQANAAQAAMGFLSSGSSPEDIAYRREQQNLGNLSAEVSGKTPQSQFGAMSGAQNGPTPNATAGALPVLPGDQTQAANAVAIQNANTTNQFNSNQANPWMTGLSSLINTGSALGKMGLFAPTTPAS